MPHPWDGRYLWPPMDDFRSRNGELHCEDVAVSAIAAAVGTPVYVYSKHTLVDHFRRLREAFAAVDPLIRYAVKANGNLAILKTLAAVSPDVSARNTCTTGPAEACCATCCAITLASRASPWEKYNV